MTRDQAIRQKLREKTVGIAGCGGLGSNCAVALARIGLGKIIIVDFDIVEKSNLNRQYFFLDQVGEFKVKALKHNIERIDPSVIIEDHPVKLNENNIAEIFKDCAVVVEAFDKAEMKMMLIETLIEKLPGKPLVCGLGLAGWGGNDLIRMQSFENVFICGDMTNEVTEFFPPLAPRVGIVANMEANQVLELLLGKMEHGNNPE